jgi:signal transduction histidine kinase
LSIVAVVGIAAVIRLWAKRDGGVGLRHTMVLALSAYAVTWVAFLSLGPRGAAMISSVWAPLLMLHIIGIGLVARLFADVVAGRAAETARREAAQLRAVTLLARAAAHEINNPLTVVVGGLGLVARKVPPDSEEAKWIERARDGSERIRDIVARMNRITQIEEAPQVGSLPPILDIKKSSD